MFSFSSGSSPSIGLVAASTSMAATMATTSGLGQACSTTDPTVVTAQLEGMLGLATLPLKLIKRIVAKEYVEMFEILLESWQLEAEASTPVEDQPLTLVSGQSATQLWLQVYW